MGYIELQSNNIEKAENYLLPVSKVKPKNPALNWMLAELYYRK